MADPNHEQNRRLWDELVEVHFAHPDYHVQEFLAGWNSLLSIEREWLGDVNGRSLLHLFCQFGQDTLSWARLGASVTGVDISGRSIELANELKARAGLEADFIQSDVLELIGRIDRKFDIVFQSYGTHQWISDLDRWAAVVTHYLEPGGTFLIVDIHPVSATVLEKVPYFEKGPHRYQDPDYADKSYYPREESVEWQHTLGEIVTALIRAGLTVERLEEFNKMCYRYRADWVQRDGYWYPPDGPPKYPMLFALQARK